MDETVRLQRAKDYLRDVSRENSVSIRQALWEVIWAVEELSSKATPPITASPTTASLSDAQAGPTRPPIQQSSLQPGEQMVADLFHAGHCSECAAALGVLLARCRTHALGVDGHNSISQSQDSQPSVQEQEAAESGLRSWSSDNPGRAVGSGE